MFSDKYMLMLENVKRKKNKWTENDLVYMRQIKIASDSFPLVCYCGIKTLNDQNFNISQ